MDALQLVLRNAMAQARPIMKLTDELFFTMQDAISMLNSKDYIDFGTGEDVATTSSNVLVDPVTGILSVDPIAGAVPGTVTFQAASYPLLIILKDVILVGTGLSFQITKNYFDPYTKLPLNPAFRIFNSAQLPLESNNFTLTVTIQPGGSYSRALMLLEMPQ